MQPTNIVYNTVTALGADCKVTPNGQVSLAKASFKTSSIIDWKYTPYVADTPQVTTVVVTATASTSYSFNLQYTNTLQNVVKEAIWQGYVSDTTPTRTEIATAAMNFVNNIGNCSVVATLTGSGDNKDLVLTAQTYYPSFILDVSSSVGVLTPTTSPAAVIGNGSGAGLLHDSPQLANDGIVSTNNYDQLTVYLANPTLATYVNGQVNQVVNVYVKTDATNVATLIGYNSTLGLAFGTLGAAVINNRLATLTAVGANVSISSSLAARASGSFVTENIKPGDGLIIGTTIAVINAPYTDGVTAANLVFADALVTGSDVSAAAAVLSKTVPLPA